MIEILVHGNKKYKTECFTCNCQFTYEVEDIDENGKLICPDCKHPVDHYSSDFVRGSYLDGGK